MIEEENRSADMLMKRSRNVQTWKLENSVYSAYVNMNREQANEYYSSLKVANPELKLFEDIISKRDKSKKIKRSRALKEIENRIVVYMKRYGPKVARREYDKFKPFNPDLQPFKQIVKLGKYEENKRLF